MPDHVYKSVEITGSATTNIEDAVRNGLRRASKTIENLRWFEVTEIRGWIENDELEHWQVTMKLGFTLED